MKYLLKKFDNQILVDAREFTPEKATGIGRVIAGLIDALAESPAVDKITLAVFNQNGIPPNLRNREKIEAREIPISFLKSEKALTSLSKYKVSLFFSPYPKLPLFGTHSLTIHMVHDVLGLTYPAYKMRVKFFFDSYRLKSALKKSDLTWYVSKWSLEETKRYAGFTGKNPKVRYNGIDKIFTPNKNKNEILMKYGLEQGYVLILGNGLPHKNLDVIFGIPAELKRHLVIVGVSTKNQAYWQSKSPGERAFWISHVTDQDLPSIIRGAFCLVQPSTMEGYGYPPLEAMACGVPCIASNIPVLRETTGGNSLFADPLEPSSWLDAINSLENRDLYQLQIRKGLNWVKPFTGRSGWSKHLSDIETMLAG